MPSSCVVIDCNNRTDKGPDKSFFRIPAVDMRYGGRNENITRKLRGVGLQAWCEAAYFSPPQPVASTSAAITS